MFKNIGDKIKGLSKFVFGIGLFVSVVSAVGIAVFFANISRDGLGIGIFLGFVVAIVGAFISWLSIFLLYGYGELIQNTTDIRRMMGCEDRAGGDSSNNSFKPKQPKNNTYTPVEREKELKRLLSLGVITQEEYDSKIQGN